MQRDIACFLKGHSPEPADARRMMRAYVSRARRLVAPHRRRKPHNGFRKTGSGKPPQAQSTGPRVFTAENL